MCPYIANKKIFFDSILLCKLLLFFLDGDIYLNNAYFILYG